MAMMAQSSRLSTVGSFSPSVGQLHNTTAKKELSTARPGPLGRQNYLVRSAKLATVSSFQSNAGMQQSYALGELEVWIKQVRTADLKRGTQLSRASKKGRTAMNILVSDLMANLNSKDVQAIFSEECMEIVHLAREEAKHLGYSFVGTEHILLGLIAEGNNVAAKVLVSMGVNLEEARVEVQKILEKGNDNVDAAYNRRPFTPMVKRVFKFAAEEARKLGHGSLTSEHLLLGLLNSHAALVLENLGLDLRNIRTHARVSSMKFKL